MPKSDNGLNRPDAWSGTHLFGSFALAIALMTLSLSRGIFDACLVAFCFGFLWELNDGRHKKWRLKHPAKWLWFDSIFDPRGFSWLDLVMDFIGCAGAGLCLWGLI